MYRNLKLTQRVGTNCKYWYCNMVITATNCKDREMFYRYPVLYFPSNCKGIK